MNGGELRKKRKPKTKLVRQKIISALAIVVSLLTVGVPCFAVSQKVLRNDIYDEGLNEARNKLEARICSTAASEVQASDLFKLSALEFSAQDLRAADGHLRQILSLPHVTDLDKSNAERFIGLCLVEQRRPAEAVSHYVNALQLLSTDRKEYRSKVLRGLNAAHHLAGSNDLMLLLEQAKIAQSLGLHRDAGWAYLNLADAQRRTGKDADADRSFQRAVDEFARFFNSTDSDAAPRAVLPDLWEVLDRGPDRPPGSLWKTSPHQAKAIIVCVHGLGLHSNAYDAFANAVVPRGIAVIAMDVRGFGHWANTREKRDIRIADAADDVVNLVAALKRINPGVPIFLLGESMGGAIVLEAGERADVSGIISSVPAADRYNSFETTMRVAWHLVTAQNSDFDLSHDVVDRVSQDEKQREEWEKDELAKLKLAPTQLISFQRFMNQNKKRAAKLTKPILITQGHADRLVKENSTIDLYKAVAADNKHLLLIGTAEHLIFEAPQISPVLVDGVVSWIQQVSTDERGARRDH